MFVAVRLYLSAAAGTFWFDEAMLAVNIRDATWHQLLRLLPYYDQAAPIGYLVLMKLLYPLSHSDWVLRIPSLAAGTAVVLIPFKYSFLSRRERALTALVIASSVIALHYSVEAKQYAFELLFAALSVRAFEAFLLPDTENERSSLAISLITLLVAMLFVSPFPILYAAAVITAFISLAKQSEARAEPSRAFPFLLVGAVYLVYYTCWVRPAYSAQMGSYGYQIDGFSQTFTRWLPWIIARAGLSFGNYFGVWPLLIFLPLFVEGLRIASRERPVLWSLLVATAVTILILNLIHVYPIMPGRQMLFVLPYIAMLIAVGMASLEERLGRWSGLFWMVTVSALAAQVFFLMKSPRFEEASKTIAYLHDHPELPVVVNWGSQPIYDYYFPARAVPGCYRQDPNLEGFTDRCSRDHHHWSNDFDGLSATPYELTIVGRYEDHGKLLGLSESQVLTVESNYLEWLVARAADHDRSLVFTMQFTNRFDDKLKARLANRGSLSMLIDERHDPQGYGPQLLEFTPNR
jgi:hypothetical protein